MTDPSLIKMFQEIFPFSSLFRTLQQSYNSLFPFRNPPLMLLSYPRSGSSWIGEILSRSPSTASGAPLPGVAIMAGAGGQHAGPGPLDVDDDVRLVHVAAGHAGNAKPGAAMSCVDRQRRPPRRGRTTSARFCGGLPPAIMRPDMACRKNPLCRSANAARTGIESSGGRRRPGESRCPM